MARLRPLWCPLAIRISSFLVENRDITLSAGYEQTIPNAALKLVVQPSAAGLYCSDIPSPATGMCGQLRTSADKTDYGLGQQAPHPESTARFLERDRGFLRL